MSVFKIIDENNSFSIKKPGCWKTPNYLEDNIIDELKNLLKLTSEMIMNYTYKKLEKEKTK